MYNILVCVINIHLYQFVQQFIENCLNFNAKLGTNSTKMNVLETSEVQVELTISKPVKVIHCSDGIEEELEETMIDGSNSVPNEDKNINPKTLSWGPWISYYTWKSSTKLLNAVDYAGESLADFLGITTPKYQIEISEYERIQEEKQRLEDESAGWVPRNTDGDIPLVLDEPVKDKTQLA